MLSSFCGTKICTENYSASALGRLRLKQVIFVLRPTNIWRSLTNFRHGPVSICIVSYWPHIYCSFLNSRSDKSWIWCVPIVYVQEAGRISPILISFQLMRLVIKIYARQRTEWTQLIHANKHNYYWTLHVPRKYTLFMCIRALASQRTLIWFDLFITWLVMGFRILMQQYARPRLAAWRTHMSTSFRTKKKRQHLLWST